MLCRVYMQLSGGGVPQSGEGGGVVSGIHTYYLGGGGSVVWGGGVGDCRGWGVKVKTVCQGNIGVCQGNVNQHIFFHTEYLLASPASVCVCVWCVCVCGVCGVCACVCGVCGVCACVCVCVCVWH